MKVLTLQFTSRDIEKWREDKDIYFDQLLKLGIQLVLVNRNITKEERDENYELIKISELKNE